jgi:hypothetical protein
MAKAFGSGMTELTKAPALNENRRIFLTLVTNDQNATWENNQFLGIGAAAGSQGVVANIIDQVSGNDTLLSFQTLEPNPAGSFTIANITVDAFGRVSTAANGGGGALTQFEVIGDSGGPVTIGDGNVLTLGTTVPSAGLSTVVINPDILQLNLNNIAPNPTGEYQVANITVNAKGIITIIASGPQNNMTFNLDGDAGPPQLIENTQTVTLTGLPEFIVSRPADPGPFIITPIEQPDMTAGTYLAANVTVNTKGLITEISQGAQFTATFDVDGNTGPTQTISSGNTLSLNGQAGITVIGPFGGPPTLGMSLDNIPDVEGSYDSANITVNTFGQITAATDGTVGTMNNWGLGDGVSAVTINNNDTVKIDGKAGLKASRSSENVSIRIKNNSVVAGTYTHVNLSVDQQGRITTAADGSVGTMSSWLFDADLDLGILPPITDAQTLNFSGTLSLPVPQNFGLETIKPIANDVQVNLIDRSLVVQEYAYPTITVDTRGIITAIVAGTNMYNFIVAADEGDDQEIVNNDTFSILGGASGINTQIIGPILNIGLSDVIAPISVTNALIIVTSFGIITAAASGIPGGDMSSWILDDTAGLNPQTITNDQTVNFAGTVFALNATVSGTDTLTLDLQQFFDPPPGPIQYPTIVVNPDGLIGVMTPTADVGSMDNWIMNTNGGPTPQTIEQGNTVTFVAGTGLELTTVGGNNWGLQLPTQGVLGSYTDAFLTVNDRGVITAVESGLVSFNIEDGDGNVGTIEDGNTLTIQGAGSDIATAVTATDTVTLSLEPKGVAGSYNVADIIANAQGLITTIAASAQTWMDDWIVQGNGVDDQTIESGDTFTIVGDGTNLTTVIVPGPNNCSINYADLLGINSPGAYGPTDIVVTEGGKITQIAQNTPQVPGGVNQAWQYRQDGVLPAIDKTQIPYVAFGGTDSVQTFPVGYFGLTQEFVSLTNSGIMYNQAAKDPAVATNRYIGNQLRDFTTINSSSANYKMSVAVLGGSGTPEDGVNRVVGPGLIGEFMHNPIDGGASDIYPGTVVFVGKDNGSGAPITGDIGGANNTGIVARILGIALDYASAGETFKCCMKGICTAWWDRGADAPFGSLITCQPRGGATPNAPPRGGVTVGRAVPDGQSQSTVGYNYIVGTSVDGGTGYSGSSWTNTILVDVNPGIIAV